MNPVRSASIGASAGHASEFRLTHYCKAFASPEKKGIVLCRRWLLQIGLVMALARASMANAEPFSRFGFCVAPVPPGCVHAANKKKKQREECAKLTESYVSLVFVYRTCLSSEMERAVREANETLESLKCPDRKGPCFTPALSNPSDETTQSFPPGE